MVRRVLFVHSGADRYGSDRCLLEIACRLDATRYQPVVAVPAEGPLCDDLRARGVPVHVLPIAVLHRSYSPVYLARLALEIAPSARALATFLQQERIDLVHTNTSHVLSSGRAARRAGLPHLCHVREIPRLPPLLSRLFARELGRRADRVVAISGAVRDRFLLPEVPEALIRVLHDGIDLSRFTDLPSRAEAKRTLGFQADGLLVGSVGRLTPWKGQHVLIEAAALVVGRVPRARFVVVGDTDRERNRSYRARLEARVAELGLEERVCFAGFQQEVPLYLAAMDVFVLTSVTPEPFGLVVLEALAAGTPVVATAHGGPQEVLEGGRFGLLVPPGDAALLAEALAHLLEDDAHRADLARDGRLRAEDSSIEKHVAALEGIYDELLGGHRATAQAALP